MSINLLPKKNICRAICVKSIFAVPPEFVSSGSQYLRRGKRHHQHHHQRTVLQLPISATAYYLCSLILKALSNEWNAGPIEYSFQEHPLLMTLFTDEDEVYK